MLYFHFIPKAIAPAHNYNPIAFGKSFNTASTIFPPYPFIAEFISKKPDIFMVKIFDRF